MIRFASLILALLLAACGGHDQPGNQSNASVEASPSPSPTVAIRPHVNDAATLLSPAAAKAVEARLTRLEATTQRRVLVVTLPTLGGRRLDDVVEAIGQRDGAAGAILVIAVKEREVRLAIGGGAERLVTRAEAQRIVEQVMRPDLHANRFEPAILKGVDSIASELSVTMV